MPRTRPIIDDVLVPGLRLVLCGMAAGPRSARERTPYIGPNNKFWPVLRDVGLIPDGFAPSRFRDLPEHGIGLTNMATTQSGADDKIVVTARDVALVRAKLRRYRPRVVGFVGKRAAAYFYGCATGDLALGCQAEPWEGMPVFVLPSTSARAQSHWKPQCWEALAAFIGG